MLGGWQFSITENTENYEIVLRKWESCFKLLESWKRKKQQEIIPVLQQKMRG